MTQRPARTLLPAFVLGIASTALVTASCERRSSSNADSVTESLSIQDTPSDQAAIDTLLENLAAAAVAADAEVYAALYDENGALMAPNEVAAVGRAAIRDWAEDFFARWELQVDTFIVDDRRIGSSVGFARYRVVGKYVPKAGGPAVPFDQKYVDTYVKDATGSWTLAAHIANSNTKARTIWN